MFRYQIPAPIGARGPNQNTSRIQHNKFKSPAPLVLVFLQAPPERRTVASSAVVDDLWLTGSSAVVDAAHAEKAS